MAGRAHAKQVASNYFQCYDKLLGVFHEIGSSLPQFHDIAEIFQGSKEMANYLGLFYAEIIEFHYQAMRFFRQTSIALWVYQWLLTAYADESDAGWKLLFDCLWPKYEDTFDIINKNIEKHKGLIDREIKIQMIKESRKARDEGLIDREINIQMIKESRKAREEALERHQEERDSKELDRLERNIPPSDYKTLEKVRVGHCAETGKWVFSDPLFTSWLNAGSNEAKQRLLWLAGVPGAGNPSVIIDCVITKNYV